MHQVAPDELYSHVPSATFLRPLIIAVYLIRDKLCRKADTCEREILASIIDPVILLH